MIASTILNYIGFVLKLVYLLIIFGRYLGSNNIQHLSSALFSSLTKLFVLCVNNTVTFSS